MRTVVGFLHDFFVIRLLFNKFKYSEFSFLGNAQYGLVINIDKKAKLEKKIFRNVNISLITHAASSGFSRRDGSHDDIRQSSHDEHSFSRLR